MSEVVEQVEEQEIDLTACNEILDKFVSEDFVSHDFNSGQDVAYPEWRENIGIFIGSFTELEHDIAKTIVKDDHIAMVVKLSMKHSNDFMGIPPTHKTLHFNESLIFRIENGKIVEEWILVDFGSMMSQLNEVN